MAQIDIGNGVTKEEKKFDHHELKLPVSENKRKLNAQKLIGPSPTISPQFKQIQ